jgi:hypothetical protein
MLPFNFSLADVYQPLYYAAPVFEYGYNNVLNLNVPDHLLVVAIKTNAKVADLNRKDLQITVYPNPASDRIYLNGLTGENEQYFIYTVNGSLVVNGATGIANPRISCDHLTAGFYFLKIVDNTSVTQLVTGIAIIK